MLYTTAKIAGKEYKLRLGAQDAADVEKRLGKSVLDVLLAMAPENPEDASSMKGVSTPCVGDLCTILHGAMQKYQHGTTLAQVFGLYDKHIDQGGRYEDFIGMLKDILEVSGFLPRGVEASNPALKPVSDVLLEAVEPEA